MLTAAGCQARRSRLWDRLSPVPDWVVVASPPHVNYFCGYDPSPFEFRTIHSTALLMLGRAGQAVLVADNMLKSFAAAAHVDEVVAPLWYKGQTSAPERHALTVQAALDWLQGRPGGRIACELPDMPAALLDGLRNQRPQLEVADIAPLVWQLRRQKEPDEIALLRLSMQAGEAGHAAALAHAEPGMTELDVYLLVAAAAQRHAGAAAWVYGDFVSGPRCEKKGGPPSTREIQRGDLVLLDFSVVVGGYRGDFANTLVCGAEPTPQQRALQDACLEALAVGESSLRPGEPCSQLDAAVRASFAAHGLAENFVSHSGHGLGLGHPEAPFLTHASEDLLLPGDIVAIEPGQYIPGVAGMRFERNYLVTVAGYETLSHHKLQLEQSP